MTGGKVDPGTPLFLDALDEYRIDGACLDKVHGLGQAMQEAKPIRWRLTCRAEDWRSSADLEAIRGTTSGKEIVVAQLLPLSYDESIRVLESLGESDPNRFMEKAHALGAKALLESPLSLKLLLKAVSGSASWPTNRHDLFESAIIKLAHEDNPTHKGGSRNPVPKIIEAAEKACLVMLLSGRRALWRSHGEPPSSGDDRAYLRDYELEFEGTLFGDMLDTSLFRGEGESFEPVHRTIAEYLAGRALAKRVTGGKKSAAFPLGRAIALVTGVDRKAPTELRGLYAWFAAHLAKLKREDIAHQLIEADAATVLAYGDAAVFSTHLRRAIFNNLDRDDPYFRSGDYEHDVAVGGLAAEDLATDFAHVLDRGSDGTHRLVTVFEALSSGTPVETLRPRLWAIACDPMRPEWERRRASDAWLNGAKQQTRDLFDAISATPPCRDRELLRIHLATQLPAATFSTGDIKALVGDFAKTEKTNTVGKLIGLTYTLVNTPRGELFDVHLNTWISNEAMQAHSVELDYFLDAMLASAIQSTSGLTAEQVWRWTNNSRAYPYQSLHEKSGKALREWLDASPDREAALFGLVMSDEDADTPWMPGNSFTSLTGRFPSATLVRRLLQNAEDPAIADNSKSILAVAVEIAHRITDDQVYQETLTAISARSDCSDLVQRLTTKEESSHSESLEQAQAAKNEKNLNQKTKNIEILAAEVDEIRAGGHPSRLSWAAKQYFVKAEAEENAGVQRITQLTNDTIAEAVLAGWRYIVTRGFVGVSVQMLGAAVGKSDPYHVEWVTFAGLDQLMTQKALPEIRTMPIEAAIAVLKASEMIRDTEKRKQFETWALVRLNAEPTVGTEQLLQFWTSAVDSGATHIESFACVRENDAAGAAVAEALYSLLNSRRSMPAALLRSALRAAVKRVDPNRLLRLAETAIADAAVSGEQHHIWLFLAFALDPNTHGALLLREHSDDGGARLYENFRRHEYEPIETIVTTARAKRESVIIQLVGPTEPPEDLWGTSNSGDVVRRAIQILSTYPEAEAGDAIQGLVQMPALVEWKRSLQHAYAQWARSHRERTFRYPTPEAIVGALDCGPPVNAADLLAVVMDVLQALRRELRTSDITPWKQYWNRVGSKVQNPLIENQCRNHLLERLRDRILSYNITAALPEAQRSEETRVDMLVLSGAGKSLPVEVKRHYHPELWEAPSTQLRRYTESEGSDRYGIYLVFWFGLDIEKTPKRKDGSVLPATASDLEAMLIADLPAEDRERMRVIVFDVSKGAAGVVTT